MTDPGSEETGGGGFEAPKIFLVNFSQFRGLLKVFGENSGGGSAPPPPDPPLQHHKKQFSLAEQRPLQNT